MFWNVVLNLIGLYHVLSFATVAYWALDLNHKGLLENYNGRATFLFVSWLVSGPFLGVRLLWRRWRPGSGDANDAPYVPSVRTVDGLAIVQLLALLLSLFAIFGA